MNIIKTLGIRRILKMRRAHDLSLKYVRGYMVSSCICALSNTGLLQDLLKKEPLNIDFYSNTRNLDKKILTDIAEYLYSVGILNKKNGYFQLSNVGGFISEYALGPFTFISAYKPLFSELEPLLKKEIRYGIDLYKNHSLVAKASAETEEWIPYPVIRKLIENYQFKNILDLGCGGGEFLMRLCGELPCLSCFGIDKSSAAISDGHKFIRQRGLDARIKLIQNDISNIKGLSDTLKQRIDVMTSMYVLHEFAAPSDVSKIISILTHLKQNFINSYLIICELYKHEPEQLRKNPSLIAEHHLFHALSNQTLLTEKEWCEIFKQTPYKIIDKLRFNQAGQIYFILK